MAMPGVAPVIGRCRHGSGGAASPMADGGDERSDDGYGKQQAHGVSRESDVAHAFAAT